MSMLPNPMSMLPARVRVVGWLQLFQLFPFTTARPRAGGGLFLILDTCPKIEKLL